MFPKGITVPARSGCRFQKKGIKHVFFYNQIVMKFGTEKHFEMADRLPSSFFGYLLHRPDQGRKGVPLEPQLFEYSR